MSIELHNVSFTYAKGTPFAQQGLKDLSVRITDGEWVVVMGPTGSGKSTFMQHLNGLLKPDQGEVLLNDINIHSAPERLRRARREVGLVFQYPEHQLFSGSVYQEVAYGPQNFGLAEQNIEVMVKGALETVGLDYESYKGRLPYELSGGEKRRVALAGVLAAAPSHIALDEPTAGLDLAGKQKLIDTVRKLNQEKGVTVIWVTHEITEVALAASRLLVLNCGRLLLDGSMREVLYDPLLKELGLDSPLAVEVAEGLQDKGWPVKGQPLSVEEIYHEILRLKV